MILNLTIIVSALLLFWVQPLFAKVVLPILGGSASVWNLCLLMYQSTLLAGYLYAHYSSQYFHSARGALRQRVIHLCLLAGGLIVIVRAWPIVRGNEVVTNPETWLIGAFIAAIGLPFFALSSTAPLIQNWFSQTMHRHAKDPYYLYAASNVGSIGGLLLYVTVLEPNLRLSTQFMAWGAGYGIFSLLMAASAVLTIRAKAPEPAGGDLPDTCPPGEATGDISAAQSMRLLVWAFIPSSLLYGVTSQITLNVASVPLFWVVPLLIYLITFVAAFSRRRIVPDSVFGTGQTLIILAYVALSVWFINLDDFPITFTLSLHLMTLLFIAMFYHRLIARSRPRVSHLTKYYILIAAGGILGAIFNAIVAPHLFDGLLEYPIVIFLAALMRPRPQRPESGASYIIEGAIPAAMLFVLLVMVMIGAGDTMIFKIVSLFAIIVLFLFNRRTLGFALGIGALLIVSFNIWAEPNVLYKGRSFYGSYSVYYRFKDNSTVLMHGTTRHGFQKLDAVERLEPQSYYHRSTPLGRIFDELDRRTGPIRVGAIGLGTGSIAAYGRAGDEFDFFEIDPVIAEIASRPDLFSYLSDSKARNNIIIGDGRIMISSEPSNSYDLIVVDAYFADSVPIHIGTLEAISMYRKKLRSRGVLAFHISNRYLDLAPVLLTSARINDFHPLYCSGGGSEWFIMTLDEATFKSLGRNEVCTYRISGSDDYLWTDDYSSVLKAMPYLHFLRANKLH